MIEKEETPSRKRKQSKGKPRKWNDEETDLLIDLFEQNACLWDVFFKDYHLRRIYTTFILGTALLNFGTRASNIGHGPLDFCRVKANFSARVPKNLDGPRPPQEVVSARLKRSPRAETRGIFVLRVFALLTDRESEGSGVENEVCAAKILYFSREERWPRRI